MSDEHPTPETPAEEPTRPAESAEGDESSWDIEPPPGGLRRAGTALLLAGAAVFLANTAGWVLVFLDVLPDYPFAYIGVGAFAVYMAGRFLRWKGGRG